MGYWAIWGDLGRPRATARLGKASTSDFTGTPRPSLGRITQAEYDEKAHALKKQQAEIATRIEQHEKGDGAFRTTLETLISVASRAADLFERSKIDQKRQLLAFVFRTSASEAKSSNIQCVRHSI